MVSTLNYKTVMHSTRLLLLSAYILYYIVQFSYVIIIIHYSVVNGIDTQSATESSIKNLRVATQTLLCLLH